MKRFAEDGSVVDFPGEPVVNDLTMAPVLHEMPSGMCYIPVAVMAADGRTPRLVLMDPTVVATTDAVLERIGEARKEFVNSLVQEAKDRDALTLALVKEVEARTEAQSALQVALSKAQSDLQIMLQAQQKVLQELSARKAVVTLPDVTIAAGDLITATVGTRSFTCPCVGLKVGDTLQVTPKNLPPSYGLRGWSIPSDGNLTVQVYCPVLTAGGTAITFGVMAFR